MVDQPAGAWMYQYPNRTYPLIFLFVLLVSIRWMDFIMANIPIQADIWFGFGSSLSAGMRILLGENVNYSADFDQWKPSSSPPRRSSTSSGTALFLADSDLVWATALLPVKPAFFQLETSWPSGLKKLGCVSLLWGLLATCALHFFFLDCLTGAKWEWGLSFSCFCS